MNPNRPVYIILAIIAAATAVALHSLPTLAQEPTLKWGLGVRSCAKFAQDFKENPETWETVYYVWAEGYMTGFNIAVASFQGKAKDLNPYERSEQWRRESIREYCASHPLAPYSEAVINLLKELAEPPAE